MELNDQIKRRADDIGRRSKVLLAYAFLTAVSSMLFIQVQAQTFAEWFSQKKTQKKYLLQQIAALQVYSGYLRQGYKIANGGLGYIGESLQNEFSLHRSFYDQLKHVNTVVKSDPKVKEILVWQEDILKQLHRLDKADFLSADEENYVGKVKSALMADCDEQITALQILLSNGKLQMNDQERISRLNMIHLAMQSNYRFAADFTGKVQIYGVHKKQETNSVRNGRSLFGIR